MSKPAEPLQATVFCGIDWAPECWPARETPGPFDFAQSGLSTSLRLVQDDLAREGFWASGTGKARRR
jgi:hypothetical protein